MSLIQTTSTIHSLMSDISCSGGQTVHVLYLLGSSHMDLFHLILFKKERVPAPLHWWDGRMDPFGSYSMVWQSFPDHCGALFKSCPSTFSKFHLDSLLECIFFRSKLIWTDAGPLQVGTEWGYDNFPLCWEAQIMSTGQLVADMTEYVVCVTMTCLNSLQCFSSLGNDTHQEGNCVMLVLYVQQCSLGSVVSLFTLIKWVCLCIYILHIGGHCISQSTSNDSFPLEGRLSQLEL